MSSFALVSTRGSGPKHLTLPIWLCPSLFNRTISSSTGQTAASARGTRKSDPKALQPAPRGREKAQRRLERLREGAKLRQHHALLEQGIRPKDSSVTQQIIDERQAEQLDQLRRLISEKNLTAALPVFKELVESGLAEDKDVSLFIGLVHNRIRGEKNAARRNTLAQILERLTLDYKGRKFPGHPRITSSLIGATRDLHKYEAAASLWEWAQAQSSATKPAEVSSREMRQLNTTRTIPEYTDLGTYGAALSVLARAGRSFEETESLYREALARCPHGFDGYHLEPSALLQNPSKVVHVSYYSRDLLTSLMISRFVHGKTALAYLCLDTLLRLQPNELNPVVQRVASEERPLMEQVQTLCLFLRGGDRQAKSQLRIILLDLRQWSTMTEDRAEKLEIIETMLMLMQLAHASSTTLEVAELNIVLTTILQTLPSTPSRALQAATVDAALDYIRHLDAIGIAIDETTTGQIAAIASTRQAPQLQAFAKVLHTNPPPKDPIKLGRAMDAYAEIGMITSIRDTWQQYHQEHPDIPPWDQLARSLAISAVTSSNRTGVTAENARNVLSQHRTLLDSSLRSEVGSLLVSEKYHSELMSVFDDMYEANTQGLLNDADTDHLEFLRTVSKATQRLGEKLVSQAGNQSARNLTARAPMFTYAMVPDEWQRGLFNETVLGVNQRTAVLDAKKDPGTSADPVPETSPTSTPLGEIRFQNWCEMNHLLLEAQAFEDIFDGQVEEALRTGTGGVQRFQTAFGLQGKERNNVLSKQFALYRGVRERVTAVTRNEETWKARITELRKGVEPAEA